MTRFVISIIIGALLGAVDKLFNFFYSPITGTATAQALVNDDLASYGWAKFVRDGQFGQSLIYFYCLILFLIWVGPLTRLIKGQRNTSAN